MTKSQSRTLLLAINHFGVEANIDKALEEMGELTTELSRRRLARYDKEKVAEEIADVLITVEKLRIIFGGAKVDRIVEKKLAALEREMGGCAGDCDTCARAGSLVGECIEAGLMAGLKSIDPDLAEKIADWAKKTTPTVVREESIHVRPVSEVVDPAPLFAMLDSDKTRVPCCAKCAKLGKDLSSNGPWCDHHGIMCGDLTKICCTEYQRKEEGSHE